MSLPTELKAIAAFGRLEDSELQALSSSLDVRDYPNDHVLIREHDRGDKIFLLFEGTVEVVREAGEDIELNRMQPGDLFGLIALIDDSPRSATCRAAGPCRVGFWPRQVVQLLINQHAPIARAFQLALGAQLARDFRQLDRRVRAALPK